MKLVNPARNLIKELNVDQLKDGYRKQRKIFVFSDLFLMVKEGLIKERFILKANIPYDIIDIEQLEGEKGREAFVGTIN